MKLDPHSEPEQVEMFDDKPTPTIAKRSKAEAAKTDSTCTPKWLTDRLPEVGLDPFSNERSTVRARRRLGLDLGLDGLVEPWLDENDQPTDAFQNHPFSTPLPFCAKAHHEMKVGRCVDLIVLCKDDSSTDWYDVLTTWYPDAPSGHVLSRPPEMWRIHGERIQYDEHPDIIEERRLERVADAIKHGKGEKIIKTGPRKGERYIDTITGHSTSNFCSVIFHFRGWRPPFARELALDELINRDPFVRRPKLDLDDIATRWVQPIAQGEQFTW